MTFNLRGDKMKKYEVGIISFAVISIIMILYVPVTWGNVTEDAGYCFLFSIPYGNHLYIGKLIIELFLGFFISVLIHFAYNRIKNK